MGRKIRPMLYDGIEGYVCRTPRGFNWSHQRPSMTTQFTRAATELTPLLQKKSLELRPSSLDLGSINFAPVVPS